MKVRIIVAQSGLYNGAQWPGVGETIDLPAHVAHGMIGAGHVEDAKSKAETAAPEVETRPAPARDVETPEKPSEAAKKTAGKKP